MQARANRVGIAKRESPHDLAHGPATVAPLARRSSQRERPGRMMKRDQDTVIIERAMKLYVSQEYSIRGITNITGISATTLYRYLNDKKTS